MHHEFAGGENCDFRVTPPGGTEMVVKPTNPAQTGLWNGPDRVPANTVRKTGNGRTFLAGNNTHTGNTEINGGELVISDESALGTADSPTVLNGGTLVLTGGVTIATEVI